MVISFSSPKFVEGDDDSWQLDGYDACRATQTSFSDHMEWCVLAPSQLSVLSIEQLQTAGSEGTPSLESIERVGAP